MEILFTLRNLLRANRLGNIFFHNLFWCLIWNTSFTSNKPTHFLLVYGNFTWYRYVDHLETEHSFAHFGLNFKFSIGFISQTSRVNKTQLGLVQLNCPACVTVLRYHLSRIFDSIWLELKKILLQGLNSFFTITSECESHKRYLYADYQQCVELYIDWGINPTSKYAMISHRTVPVLLLRNSYF